MQALRCSGRFDVAACSVSRGISAADFTRNLLRLCKLLWRFRHAMSSKTAYSLLSSGLRSALLERQFSVLMKARSFLHSHSWIVLVFWAGTESCWKTHSWPLKRAMLRCFTTPCSTSSCSTSSCSTSSCSTSSWYTQTQVSHLSLDDIKLVTKLMARPILCITNTVLHLWRWCNNSSSATKCVTIK